jgi:hypothetical protein
MVEQAPPAASHRSRTRVVVQAMLSLVLVLAISSVRSGRLPGPDLGAADPDRDWLLPVVATALLDDDTGGRAAPSPGEATVGASPRRRIRG